MMTTIGAMTLIDLNTPKPHQIVCIRSRGGKKPFWNAWHMDHFRDPALGKYASFCGAGNSADGAIKDYQKQFRAWASRQKG